MPTNLCELIYWEQTFLLKLKFGTESIVICELFGEELFFMSVLS